MQQQTENLSEYGSVNPRQEHEPASLKNYKRSILMGCFAMFLLVALGVTGSPMRTANLPRSELIVEVVVPGTSKLERAYNIFRGKFVDDAYSASIGRFSHPTPSTQNTIRLGDANYLIVDGCEVLSKAQCAVQGTTTSSQKTSSTYDLTQEGDSKSFGYDSTTTVSASVPVGPAEVGASRDMRTALMFGNTQSMTESYTYSSKQYSYRTKVTFSASEFTTTVKWNNPATSSFAFSSSFVSALNHVGSLASSSTAQKNQVAFQFFDNYGSHVVSRALFGAKCQKDVYFQSGYRQDAYSKTTQTSKNNEMELFGVKFGSSGSSSSIHATDTQTGVTYEETSEVCLGVIQNNMCDQKQSSTAVSLQPIISQADLLPIWSLTVAGVTSPGSVQQVFLAAVDELLRAEADCSLTKCGSKGGKGVCTLSQSFWSRVSSWNGVFQTSDFNQDCVCEIGIGSLCDNSIVCLPDMPGWDATLPNVPGKSNVAVSDLKGCHDMCVADTRCYFFAYDKVYKKCWLRENGQPGYSAPRANVIISKCRGDDGASCERFLGHDMPGGDMYTNAPVENMNECENLCIAHTGCKAYVYLASTKKCWLKNRLGGLVANSALDTARCRN